MKIIHVIDHMEVGGGQKLVYDLSIAQARVGNEVEVLSICKTDNFLIQNMENEGVLISHVYDSLKYLKNPITPWKLRIRLKDADIIHVHLFPANYWCALYKRFCYPKAIVVTTEHSTNNKRRDKWILKPLEKFIYRQLDGIVGCSHKTTETLSAFLKTDRVVTIENGVDTSRFRDAKPYTKAEVFGQKYANSKIIMMVARFWPPKDQKTIIRALSHLDSEIVAAFVGNGGKMDESIAYAKELGLEERCIFLGLRSDVDRLVNTSDINILSSEWEGLSLSSVECMSAGKPFIGTNVRGIKEIVEGSGLLFEYSNDKQLAEQIRRLLSDEVFYEDIASKCQLRAKKFNIDNCCKEYLRFYKQIKEKYE